MSFRNVVMTVALNLGFVAMPAAQALAYAEAPDAAPTPEQTQWVKNSVRKLREAGLPAPLQAAPNADGRTQIMVSDAISVVEVAHVDFARSAYYLSVRNPWTNVTEWYGEFPLIQ